jgi:hypothetical protein
MINSQIDLFGGAFIEKADMSFEDANKVSTAHGYILHPQLCDSKVVEWVKKQRFNPNTTFYKTWSELYKSDLEMVMDQLLHYITSYYGESIGVPVYIPNDQPEELPFKNFKTLKVYSKEDVVGKVNGMLSSGIALSEGTMGALLSIISDLGIEVDLSSVKNKEFLMYYHKNNGTVPNDETEFIRFLIYLATESTSVIKDKKTLEALKSSRLDISNQIKAFGVERLAKVYLRHKKLLLCLKNKQNAFLINKIARLSKKFGEPYKPAFVETILSDKSARIKLPNMLPNMKNFKKIALLQTIMVRMNEGNIRPFIIRNGKVWIKEGKAPNHSWYGDLFDIIYQSLVESISKKACEVVLNENIVLALPTSEKNFIGNIPMGSYIDFKGKDAIIGINWREADGARDLDLSLIDMDGKKIGWNSYWNKNDILYSGDMTRANPEATECITSKYFPRATIKVNGYNVRENSKFKFFFADEKTDKLTMNYTVNPDNILFSTELICGEKEEQLLGVVEGNKFVFANIRTGKKRVSDKNITENFSDYWFDNSKNFVSLHQVLLDAGFKIVKETETGIDLRNLDKSALINLIS